MDKLVNVGVGMVAVVVAVVLTYLIGVLVY